MSVARFLIPFFLFCAGLAHAEQARVRSGEHRGFTRLVIDLPRASEWSLTEDGRDVRVQIAKGVTGFDVGSVFDRISRSTISSVKDLGSSLAIELGCDCEIKSYVTGDRMLVLDARPSTKNMARPSGEAVLFSGVRAQTMELSFGARETPPHPKVKLPLFTEKETVPAEDRASKLVLKTVPEPKVAEARDRVIGQLARAASQGLVDPLPTLGKPRPKAELDTAAGDEGKESHRPSQVAAQTASDRDLARHLSIGGKGVEMAKCVLDSSIEVGAWGDEEFSKGLAHWRAMLFGEFDRIDPKAVRGMARHYIHFGMGAEARKTLELSEDRNPVLFALARLVEGEDLDDPHAFSEQTECEGAASLWAVLAAPKSQASQINTAAVLRSFVSLPDHLRKQIGPRLSRKLLKAGADETAKSVLRRLDQMGAEPVAETHMAQGEMALEKQAPEEAAVAFEEAVNTNTELSPSAVVQMVRSEVDAGWPISVETAELVSAFAFENRESALKTPLLWTEALAMAAAGQFISAVEAMDRIPGGAEDKAARSEVVDLVVKDAPDDVFLQIALPRITDLSMIKNETENNVAERLIKMGFPSEARRFLEGDGDVDDGGKRRLLRAKASLGMGLPRGADLELLGLSGQEADLLRARSREMAGDYAAAAQIYLDARKPAESERTAFLAGEWARFLQNEDASLAALAELKTEPVPPESPGLLGRSQSLLQDSGRTREVVDQLLRRFPVDETQVPASAAFN